MCLSCAWAHPRKEVRRWAGAIGLCPRGYPTKLACDPPGEGLEVRTEVDHSSMNEYSGLGWSWTQPPNQHASPCEEDTAGGTGSIGVGWGTMIAHAARPEKRKGAHFHPGTLYQLWVGSVVHGIRPHAYGRSGPGLIPRLETTFPESLGGGALLLPVWRIPSPTGALFARGTWVWPLPDTFSFELRGDVCTPSGVHSLLRKCGEGKSLGARMIFAQSQATLLLWPPPTTRVPWLA